MNAPSKNTLDLLLEYEVGGGQSYYNKKLSRFTWPGGASGPTIGIGIDTAYYTPNEINEIFNFLPHDQIELIQKASGKKGQAGKEYTSTLRKANIVVTWDHAIDIFDNLTWTKFSKAAERTFPGLTDLHEDAYGAIVSLVFNRGTSLAGESRREMRVIKMLVPTKNYTRISQEFRSMKRIWEGKGLDGLLRRRDAEADLIENCA